MALIYDLLVVLILIVFFAFGVRKGFIKSILSLICFVLSVVLSLFLSERLAEPIYEMCFKESVTSLIEENLDKLDVTDVVNSYILDDLEIEADDSTIRSIIGTDGDITQNIKLYAEGQGVEIDEQTIEDNIDSFVKSDELENALSVSKLDFLSNAVLSGVEDSTDAIVDILQACVSNDKGAAAEAIEETFVNDALVSLVKCVLFLIFYIIIRFLLKLLVAATGIINKIPVAGKINRALGGAFGILKGGVFVLLVAVIVVGLSYFLSGSYSIFSESTIDNSLIFKYIYNMVK
ncbi:MAG: CvpA family protein [Ruminococcus sp.]|nr:CvpA family protein [Ruminococcus sp.]